MGPGPACRRPGTGLLCASPRMLGVSDVSSVLPGACPGAESGIRDAPAFCLFPEVWAEVFPLTDRSEALACSGRHLVRCQVPRSSVPACYVHRNCDVMSVLNGRLQGESSGWTYGPCGALRGRACVGGVRDRGQGTVLPGAGPSSRGGSSVRTWLPHGAGAGSSVRPLCGQLWG